MGNRSRIVSHFFEIFYLKLDMALFTYKSRRGLFHYIYLDTGIFQ